ncbi:MFS transporter [Spongiactinospora gelatinilytica]|uniref:MFS transporter n=1 Tax=Spongiactinospora gelatinilytica TaxID=2666298 RepID=A0A2W2IQE5_9ACTN|nr:sugar porter family MFS transporter [Spongiactinospora gelatinilytica]PZG51994.1 MFS transporter [Spongiactinospora gelatinilytica]
MTHGFPARPVTHEHGDHDVPPHARRRLATWAAFAALGGFLFGYDTGVVSGALLFIREDFRLGPFQQGSVVSILLLGAMAGALAAGRLADRYGRRPALIVIAVVYTIGLLLAALSPGYPLLLMARLVLGLGVGGASAIVPVYLSEIAPTRIRGLLVSLNQLLVTIGILVSYCVDLALAGTANWRGMFAVGLIFSVAMFLGVLTVPETPAWLERNGRHDRARRVLGALHPPHAVDDILPGYTRSREEQGGKQTWRRLFASSARPALVIGLTLAALQQLAGINTIIYYAPSIMEKTGLNASNSLVYAILIGAINVVLTAIVLPVVDRLGRRPLLIISLTVMAAATVPLGLSFTPVAGDASSALALGSMLVYIAAFAAGLGPVFWLLNSEIYPPFARAQAAGLATMVNWLANFVVGLTFLPLAAAIGQALTFWIFGVICVLALVFVIRSVPETKGRSFRQIDEELQHR